jgi:hypothetical protein
MRKSIDSFVWAASLVLVVGTLTAARAGEPKCDCPQQGVPILTKIPYVSRLFKNVGVAHEPGCAAAACQQAGACPEASCDNVWERIGIDFEVCPECPEAEVFRFGPVGVALGIKADGECCCPYACRCELACKCAPGVCHAVATEAVACGKVAACPAACEASCAKTCAGNQPLWEKLVELAGEKGAAQAALETHLAAREEQSELLDALVEMAAKAASLEARLEAQTEHARLTEQMLELAVENARLKSQVELAAAKEKLLETTIPVAVERELLARRVAELEEKLSTSSEGVRTARKAGGKKVE